eukprot:s2425_g5.t1
MRDSDAGGPRRVEAVAASQLHRCAIEEPLSVVGAFPADLRGRWLTRLLETCGESEVLVQSRTLRGRQAVAMRLCDFAKLSAPSAFQSETLLPDVDEELVDQILSSLPAALREDLFDRFPRCLRPSRLCLFGATAGAQCDAHADHLDWTGWSLLLSGRKLWRFLPNTPATAEALAAWREPFGLSGPGGELFSIAGSWNTQEDFFEQDSWQGVEVLQQAGEIIVFPGSWFHQTRAEEDSWAVCAQLLNTSNVDSVVGHLCDWCKIPRPISSTAEQKMSRIGL